PAAQMDPVETSADDDEIAELQTEILAAADQGRRRWLGLRRIVVLVAGPPFALGLACFLVSIVLAGLAYAAALLAGAGLALAAPVLFVLAIADTAGRLRARRSLRRKLSVLSRTRQALVLLPLRGGATTEAEELVSSLIG